MLTSQIASIIVNIKQNTNSVVGLLIILRWGVLSIKQSKIPGGPSILLTSFAMYGVLISLVTSSIGVCPFLLMIVVFAPLINKYLTSLDDSIWSAYFTARWSAVLPSQSSLSMLGRHARIKVRAISDYLKQAQCKGVEPFLSILLISSPSSLKIYNEGAASPYAPRCSIFSPVAVLASLSAPNFNNVLIASRLPLKLAKCSGVNPSRAVGLLIHSSSFDTEGLSSFSAVSIKKATLPGTPFNTEWCKMLKN